MFVRDAAEREREPADVKWYAEQKVHNYHVLS